MRRSLHSSRPLVSAVVAAGLLGSAAAASTAGASGSNELSPAVLTTQHGSHRPLIIGHRGASGYRPEHTLASYTLAIEMGADYIEPDLVSTKDGVLVARHEPEISGTTDVAEHAEFANRRTTKTVDGAEVTGWFTDDFTLAELKTLRAKERLPELRVANTAFDGLYEIPTFQEVIDLAQKHHVGIYPETKHPTYFQSEGLALEPPLVKALDANGYRGHDAKVFVQSFETANLRRLATMTDVPLIQLMDEATAQPYDFVAAGDQRTYGDLMTPAALADIAGYADGIGPWKNSIVPRDAQEQLLAPTTLIADAHAAGLQVHPYTFRRENTFLLLEHRQGNPTSKAWAAAIGDFPAELRMFFDLGVDGIFTDNADVAVAVRSGWQAPR